MSGRDGKQGDKGDQGNPGFQGETGQKGEHGGPGFPVCHKAVLHYFTVIHSLIRSAAFSMSLSSLVCVCITGTTWPSRYRWTEGRAGPAGCARLPR